MQAVGRVVLDIDAELVVEPGPPGSRVRFEGNYDGARFVWREESSPPGALPWSLRLGFRRRAGIARSIVSGIRNGSSDPVVRVFIPRDVPIALDIRVRGLHPSNLELGGLAIVDLDLRFGGANAHDVRFSRPAPFPMNRMTVHASVADIRIHELGNAGPMDTVLTQRLGLMELDLRGAWTGTSRIRARLGAGTCRLLAPRGLDVRTDAVSIGLGRRRIELPIRIGENEQPDPVVSLDVFGTLGEVEILTVD